MSHRALSVVRGAEALLRQASDMCSANGSPSRKAAQVAQDVGERFVRDLLEPTRAQRPVAVGRVVTSLPGLLPRDDYRRFADGGLGQPVEGVGQQRTVCAHSLRDGHSLSTVESAPPLRGEGLKFGQCHAAARPPCGRVRPREAARIRTGAPPGSASSEARWRHAWTASARRRRARQSRRRDRRRRCRARAPSGSRPSACT